METGNEEESEETEEMLMAGDDTDEDWLEIVDTEPRTNDRDESDKELNSKLCTFTATKNNFMEQHWYYCYTCNLTFSEGKHHAHNTHSTQTHSWFFVQAFVRSVPRCVTRATIFPTLVSVDFSAIVALALCVQCSARH